jgi:phage gp36-like protein
MAEYCTVAEIAEGGVSDQALDGIPVEKQRARIRAASDLIDSYLRQRYTLPLQAFGDDIREACEVIAAHELIFGTRGASPDDDSALSKRYDKKIRWLEQIAAGKVTPDITDSSPGAGAGPAVAPGKPRVISASSRGWSVRGTGQTRGPFQAD